MNNKCYIEQSLELIEVKLNKIISKNPHLINSLDRSDNHPLIKKNSKIPFFKQ